MNGKMIVTTVLAFAAAVSAFAEEPTSVTTNGVTVSVSNRVDAAVYSDTLLKEDGISLLKFWTTGFLQYAPEGIPTYEGGTELRRGQIRIKRSDIFGSGPVKIGTESGGSTAFMVDGVDLAMTNKVVFCIHGAYIAAFGDGSCVRLTSVGTENAYHSIRLGREHAGAYSRIELALDSENSEALSRIELTGIADVYLDGGTLKFRADSDDPFFRDMSGENSSTVTVAKAGITFDAEAGADVRLGVPLGFEKYDDIEVLETYTPENSSFESALSVGGWSITAGNGETGEIKSNGSAFDTNGDIEWHTTEGDRYLMLRQGATLSCTVNIPNDGLWRVKFLRGCRPPETGGYSKRISTDVMIDGEVKHTFAAISTDESQHPFTEFHSSVFSLTKGGHVFALRNGAATKNNHFNFDAITFERVEVTERQGSVVKTGAGAMALESAAIVGAPLEVEAGTMLLDNVALSNAEVKVSSNAVNRLFNCTIDGDSEISVASGGTLAFVGNGVNYVKNGSFEADGKHMYSAVTPAHWTFVKNTEADERSGLQSNGGALTSSGPDTTCGETTVFLREGFAVETTVDCPADGDYEISFLLACRKYEASRLLPVKVKVDGNEIASIPAHDENYDYTRYTYVVSGLAAGEHVLSIGVPEGETRFAQGSMVFVDDVSMKLHRRPAGRVEAAVRLASGSTLDLGFDGVLELASVYVDGEEINGGNAALSRAGVTVTGTGRVRAGDMPGLHVIVK